MGIFRPRGGGGGGAVVECLPSPSAGGLRSDPMKNPLDSLWGTVLCGLALTAVLYYLVRTLMGG